MVTLVSIKLTGESNIIDDNPTMKQADEMSLVFTRNPNNFNVFSVLMSNLEDVVRFVHIECEKLFGVSL